ncbi:asparagine synthase [Gigaspora margarita]|uniref:Asparagine synthase n=1 Tax=Gigaspora margarita TaxID=4874 RepID=A0A8H4B0L4_GIGMA|nr:asparagine synthase [Gigaspora margarita]
MVLKIIKLMNISIVEILNKHLNLKYLIIRLNLFLFSDVVTAWTKIHSFSIRSPDLITAYSVAEFLGTDYHEYTFTVQEDLDALDIIYHLEPYDVTTIRTSTPIYLLLRKISGMGIKMVLSGEKSNKRKQ